MMMLLSNAWLCPGSEDTGGAHVVNSANCCDCGNSNLASLARILDQPVRAQTMLAELSSEFREFHVMLEELPSIKKLFS